MRDTPNNETVIVEYGFTDSTGDDVSLIKNNWQNLAEAVVKALATYVGVSYSSPEVETNVSNNIYIVKKGDTLWSIAKKYNTTVDKLKSINNLSTNNLSIGQKLVTDIVLSDYYIVKKGDTLFQIAKNFNTSVQKLKDINNLSSDFLSINQKLVVPNSQNIYVVKSGDTLYSIANKYNTTVDNIKNINNLNSNIINIGQELII